ncbi:hydantoinase/oxoprolinase family protein [Aeoliella sp. ICT_H6.2]|uniref:Hydantoinase/oxoprolinase family protein n=1 Tax=Aeoliella straminimaris TaxID=2954799 RepID=A0A9X2JGB2_9BACT|nr:hydantoinase/oxoprolinase family protein [Aeoliella straminimaris]MCO6044890.1 hydantoinase/oxoprolinase family protein [Aeoliella straminimaris]
MTIRIGVDTGGTFTDVVADDCANGKSVRLKVPSTREDPSEAIASGVVRALQQLGKSDVARLVHGTTVATNALLERRGARTALVTTAGFRDLLAIARQNRPALYDLRARRTPPLIPRHLRLEVSERVDAEGKIRAPLDLEELERVIDQLESLGVESVAVGLLFSHVNPAHELATARRIAERLPSVGVTMSHTMAAVPGEYERLSTTAVNAFVQPVMHEYLTRLTQRLESEGVRADVMVMKSSGGVGPAAAVAEKCVETVLSGPAGGVMACVDLAHRTPHQNLIAADMGGTSFDVAVVTAGQESHARDTEIAGHPLRTPMLDLSTIGAGGGSIAWVDTGGSLRVGPQSAGAVPGPACYGRGGDLPTVTDANLVLGRLTSDSRLAGGMQLDLAAARKAFETHLAKPLGLSVEEAAAGVLRVVNASMTAAIRQITVQRGIDPRDYAICAYGGAGPLHAAELACELGVRTVVVPRTPGVFSAEGLLSCDLREDRMQSRIELLADADLADVAEQVRGMEQDAAQSLAADDQAQATWSLGLRYLGQTEEIAVAFDLKADAAKLAQSFSSAHEQLYGFARGEHAVQLASLWVSVTVPTTHAEQAGLAASVAVPKSVHRRPVYFAGNHIDTGIYRREDLGAGSVIEGPAVIEQDDTTTVTPPGWSGQTLATGELVLTAPAPS